MALARPWTLSLAAVALGVYWLLGAAPQPLVLDQAIPLAAEPWRLLSAHLAHSDARHLLWDVAGLLLVGWLFEPGIGRRTGSVLIGSAIIIAVVVRLARPELTAYCGLSGLINALVGAGLVSAWPSAGKGSRACPAGASPSPLPSTQPGLLPGPSAGPSPDWPRLAFALLVGVKLVWEGLSQQPLVTTSDWAPLQLAHIIGFTAGLALALIPGPVAETLRGPRGARPGPRQTALADRARAACPGLRLRPSTIPSTVTRIATCQTATGRDTAGPASRSTPPSSTAWSRPPARPVTIAPPATGSRR